MEKTTTFNEYLENVEGKLLKTVSYEDSCLGGNTMTIKIVFDDDTTYVFNADSTLDSDEIFKDLMSTLEYQQRMYKHDQVKSIFNRKAFRNFQSSF